MPSRHSLSFALAFLFLLFTAGFHAPRAGLSVGLPDDPVLLPIEVLGSDGHTEAVTLQVDDPDNLNRLWLKVHRPGYRDQLTNPRRGAKASVRLNGGPWIDLTNETATVDEPGASFGGIGGEARTVRFSVPVQGVQQGANTVTFRFNGTDGLTSGYRVLALNFLSGGPQGAKALPQSTFEQDDPADWQPPLSSPSDIEEGERLWHEAEIYNSDLQDATDLAVSCAGCHAEDGSDLKYFAYSNKSIQARAEFHGLTTQQGRQIASYIRSLELRRDNGTTYEAPGRPWNPPYQPGPGLDDQPVEEWAAGVGLEGVLEDDADMLSSIFPGGITKEAIAPDQTMSVTEQPIAMQLPDWNDWLPEIHPEDVWGDYFTETATIESDPPGAWRDDVLGHYQVLSERLENEGVSSLIQRGDLDNLVGRLTEAGIQFFLQNGGFSRKPRNMRREEVAQSIRHWTVVKLWEISQKHSLGDEAPQIYGENGDERSWLGQARSVFELAPDLAADNGRSFRYQTRFAGKHSSTAWYQLQILLNTGNGSGGPIQPVDWSYHPAHVNGLYAKVRGPAHPLRQTQAYAKLLQLYHTEAGLDGPFNIRQLHPVNYVLGGKYANVFETMAPSVRPQVYGALLGALMDEMDRFSESEWQAHRDENDLRPANYRPRMVQGEPLASVHHQGRYADAWYSMIPIFDEDGVDADVLNRVVDWGEMMWPRGDWDAVRPQGGGGGGGSDDDGDGGNEDPGTGTGLTATYFADKELSDEAFTRTDAEVDFRWNRSAPDSRLNANHFSARWTGDVEPLRSGEITFHVSADDGARLWVGEELLVDQWHRGPVEAEGAITLTAGERVPLRLEYREHRGEASVKLEWESQGHGRRVIPQSQLYPSDGGSGETQDEGGATYEAEDAALAGAQVNENHDGFSGDGFANFMENSGAEVTWTVEASEAGQTNLSFRYALQSAPRTVALVVNGDVVDPALTFGSTSSWTTWRTKSATVQLQAGSNTVALRTMGEEGPNTDGLEVGGGGGGESPALQTARADQAASKAALGLPTAFALAGNYPNPFREATTIQYALPEAADVKIEVFDALGRRVAVLADERQSAGHREVRFDAAGMAPGVYFVRLKAGDFAGTQKAMLVR